jgi:hypothetical protein
MQRRDLAIFVLCVIPRILALLRFPPDTSVFYYWEAASGLLAFGVPVLDGVPDTSIEPLYPALLALLRALGRDSTTVVVFAQIAIASGAGVVFYRLTEHLAGPRPALVAAVLYALDPYLVRQSVSPVEITLCIALLVAATWAYARGRSTVGAIGTGLLVALTALTRFSLLPVAAGGIALYLWRRRWGQAVAFALAVVIPVGAWTLRLHALNGALVPTRVGVNLFVSTCEYSGQVIPLRNVDLLVPWAYETIGDHHMPLDPMALQRADDAVLFARAIAFARRHPLETARLKLRNLAYTFAPVLLPLERKPRHARAAVVDGRVRVEGLEPRPLLEHVLYSGSRLFLVAGAVAGLFRRRGAWRRGDGMLLAVAVSVITVNTVFFPTSRLLAPMAFVLMFYAAVAGSTGSTGGGPRRP